MSPRQIAWQRVEADIPVKLHKRVQKALPFFAAWSVASWEGEIRRIAAELASKEGRYHGRPGGGRW
jgi:hypothetical protein